MKMNYDTDSSFRSESSLATPTFKLEYAMTSNCKLLMTSITWLSTSQLTQATCYVMSYAKLSNYYCTDKQNKHSAG